MSRYAELWTDWLVVLVNYLNMGEPKSSNHIRQALGSYHVTGEQQLAAECMKAELISFCALKPNLHLGEGRGIQKIFNVLSKLSSVQATEKFSPDETLRQALDVATDVNPDRIALADPAGQCHPEKYITKEQATQLNDLPSLLLPAPRLGEIMKPCYRLPKHFEANLQEYR